MFKPACACATSLLRNIICVKPTSTCKPAYGVLSIVYNPAFLILPQTQLCRCNNSLSEKRPDSSKQLIEVSKLEKALTDTKRKTLKERFQVVGREIFTKMFPYKKRYKRVKMLEAAGCLYEEITDEVNVQEFFDDFHMPDTYASWFTVLELHVYLVSARVMYEPDIGLHVRDMVTDSFWEDAVYRSLQLGPRASVYRKKQIMILANQFQAAFYGYDEGVQSSDRVLAAALWRRFFGFECDDAHQIERLVKYMRVQLQRLKGITFDDLLFQRPQLFVPLSQVTV